ncbi:LrgB family protein [Paracoccus aminophilus]|uniref:LrgB family protein n=1 Tax=Paracoccus aminophilus JCM 7686 TaxID=1367847 RepID=S5YGT5_PARAH|nr:LrgB family protein [Paracoccus aminophilus]AGT10678.1 LrgB family protein [Paracoccus aminophilus JCM 7686]
MSGPALFWLGLTLAIWPPCLWLARRLKPAPLDNPLVLAAVAICLALGFSGTAPGDYLAAVQPVTLFISIATVALALPLWHQRRLIARNGRAMFVASLIASLTGILGAIGAGWALGLSPEVLASIGPKATTLAVALPLSQMTGGWDSLAMAAVMCNGVGGILISDGIWRLFGRGLGPEDRGFALGTTSHAMGIARTLAVSPEIVSLASCGMLLSALMTVLIYGAALSLFG